MKLEKKQFFLIIIVCLGSLSTLFSAYWYFISVYQEDMDYGDIPFQRGMSFTTWGGASFNSTQSRDEILEMKAVGIEWIAVNVWWSQDNISATEIYASEWTDTAANLTDFFIYIHAQGMKVLFKPMLDSKDGIWRSYIEASSEWIEEYNRFIKYTAEIAENGSVEVLSIGCEMANWQIHESDVVNLISEVRKIYSGKLTYSANHDSFWYINFWDKLDIIGVDAYFAFTLSYNPTLQDMIEVWDGFYDDMTKLQRRWKKPILFTELGCQNRDGANIAPNDNKFNLNQDEDEFQMYYQSLFESKIWVAPWFKGAYWWIWDLRQINESTDNGFTPQLSKIQSTLQQYYSTERIIVYPNFLLEFLLIIILGSMITIGIIFIVQKSPLKSKMPDTKLKDGEIDDEMKRQMTQKTLVTSKFILINGLAFGSFISWSFTYYNQSLFNVLYSAVTKSLFLGGGITLNLTFIFISLISMMFLWILLQRLVYYKVKKRTRYISYIIIISSILIFVNEIIYSNVLSNEVSITFFITLQIMILLGIIFTLTFIYGFPHKIFKGLTKSEKIQLIFKLSFSIIALSMLILIVFSFLMVNYIRLSSLIIGVLQICILVLYVQYQRKHQSLLSDTELVKHIPFKERMKINKMKVFELIICISALGYYVGILRFYDIHALMNFNLSLLPNFFLPIGFSVLIGIPLILGLYLIIKSKIPSLSMQFNLERNNRLEILNNLLKKAIYASIFILIACWLLPDISFYIALIFGGIPILIFLIIYLIGSISDSGIFEIENSWKRLTIYLIICLTIAFTINGVSISLLYILTFLVFKDGQFVVRTTFDTELGYDAIGLIYNIQLFVALVPIILSLIIAILLFRKTRK
jgi:hypothetical protein